MGEYAKKGDSGREALIAPCEDLAYGPNDMKTTRLRQPSIRSIALPVIGGGAAALALAIWTLATSPDPGLVVALIALLAAATFAEAFPVPLEPAGEVSLAAVFVMGAALTYGWAPAVVVATLTVVLVDGYRRKQPIQVAYNSAVYGLSGAAAGAAVAVSSHGAESAGLLLLGTIGAISAFFVTNMVLTTAIIARIAGRPFGPLLRTNAHANAGPFAIMGSVSLMLAVLWNQSPLLMGALAGPLIAVALYQRSVHKAMRAMRLALTDPQTGLGNKRHFEELLQRYLDRADSDGTPVTLCLVDVDDFKTINDTYGHVAGDRALAQVAARLRRGGESFRVGGDEFALLLPGRTTEEGRIAAEALCQRVVAARYDHGGAVSISIGVATYPSEGVERTDLVRVADKALYSAKGHGKARVHVYSSDGRMPSIPTALAGRAAGIHKAASAANAVVARDVYIGSHSHNVGELAARLARRLGLDAEEAELIRVAGSLHDIGKLLIPEEILHKPGSLTPTERSVVERHSEIGCRMLESLGLDPIATWVLHHHERFDGDGYPDGLVGEEIPLPARILFVADAWDTITTDRVYRQKMTRSEALAEIERCSGTQFDPTVVNALREELADTELELVLPASA
jgi:diguanylate cyclase (GGDEF)-like protein/putative nucleotidyltransferase with HDIG domain